MGYYTSCKYCGDQEGRIEYCDCRCHSKDPEQRDHTCDSGGRDE